MPTKNTKVRTKQRVLERPALSVQVASKAGGIPPSRKFKRWATEALRCRARVTVRIVGKREGRALNHKYRGRDYATNVLTFTYAGESILAGDIALCAPIISCEARSQGKPLDAHYAHMLVHGLLHLQGHDHRVEREAARMEAREVAILKRLGYNDPYSPARA